MSEAAKSFAKSDPLRLRTADLVDVHALVGLINAAFRVELPFIEGDRVDADGVRSYMLKGKFLVAEDSEGLAGCAYVQIDGDAGYLDRKSTRLNSSHGYISYAVFCLKKKKHDLSPHVWRWAERLSAADRKQTVDAIACSAVATITCVLPLHASFCPCLLQFPLLAITE